MLSRITGQLVELHEDRVELEIAPGIYIEVMLPTFAMTRLADRIGQSITLYTITYLESQNQGASFVPRLAGFLTPSDRAFYELFTTTKGIGNRKALRALAMPAAQIAAAIADRDTKTLQALPEIGKRTAETIVVTLKNKVDRFVSEAAYGSSDNAASDSTTADKTDQPDTNFPSGGKLAREALEVLLQLGENRNDAVMWIDKVLSRDESPRDTEALIAAVYQIKAGG